MYKIPCQNCKGKGELSHFKHVENGICFKCDGSKFQEATQEEYNDYNRLQELIQKGEYILFNNGTIEYYKTEKQIYQLYGNFFAGEYGWSAKISYNDKNIAYWKHTEKSEEIIKAAKDNYKNVQTNELKKKIKRSEEMLKDENDIEFIEVIKDKINKFKLKLDSLY